MYFITAGMESLPVLSGPFWPYILTKIRTEEGSFAGYKADLMLKLFPSDAKDL